MDENTIFNNPVAGGQTTDNKSQEKIEVHNFEPPSSTISSSKIVKFIIGLFIIFLVAFLIFGFVFPQIFKLFNKEKVVLVYWGMDKEESILEPLISDFENKYSQIDIQYVNQDINQYKERLTTRIDNGTGPDVFTFHNAWVFLLKDVLLPFPTSVITKEDFSKNFYPVIVNDLVINGAIYGAPLNIDTLGLYINSDLFNAGGFKAPTNWIDFQNYARVFTVKDEANKIKTAGAAMGTSNNVNHAQDIISMLMAQNGVTLRSISDNVDGAADALNFYSSFAIPSLENVWDETLESSLRSFAFGSLAMYFGYAKDYTVIKSINPNLSFEIHPIPQLPGQHTTIASYLAQGVSLKSRHQEEAFLFMKYLLEKGTAQKLFESEVKVKGFGMPYARLDLAESLKNDFNTYPFVASAPSAISSFLVDETFGDLFNSAIDSILRGTAPLSAAETLGTGVSQILQEYSD